MIAKSFDLGRIAIIDRSYPSVRKSVSVISHYDEIYVAQVDKCYSRHVLLFCYDFTLHSDLY